MDKRDIFKKARDIEADVEIDIIESTREQSMWLNIREFI